MKIERGAFDRFLNEWSEYKVWAVVIICMCIGFCTAVSQCSQYNIESEKIEMESKKLQAEVDAKRPKVEKVITVETKEIKKKGEQTNE